MTKVDINKVTLIFECEDHDMEQQITPLDLALCGTPLCQICNEEMSIESHVLVDRKDDDWENADLSTHSPEDLFECKDCEIEFGLDSDKIKGKNVVCPICIKNLKAWQKRA